jgi:post-segregation antitoxin (ccd killing protein)
MYTATISVRVSAELKAKMKKYGIKASEVARRAWEEEIKRRELE